MIVREFPGEENGVLPCDVWRRCSDWLKRSTAVAAGPGWGEVQAGILAGLRDYNGPVVLDADALNLLARNPALWTEKENIVITPHPGEAARLARAFGVSSGSREELCRQLAGKLKAVVLLKGKFTRIASPDGRESVILSGSPALATAGSGDVLTGIIGALLAMGVPPYESAVLGSSLHGRAGEIAGRGCIADDLPLILRDILKELGK